MLHLVAFVRAEGSEAMHFSETSVLTKATQRNISEDWILHINKGLPKHDSMKAYGGIW
jgi:hypothetical protein